MIAKFRCNSCGHYFERTMPMSVSCDACGHAYCRWLNWEAFDEARWANVPEHPETSAAKLDAVVALLDRAPTVDEPVGDDPDPAI